MDDAGPMGSAASDLTGKARRVIGTFVVMIGASLILDAHIVWVGLPLLLGGAAVLGWGMVAARPQDAGETRIEQVVETRL